MSSLEELFRPIYLLILFVGYAYFFVRMIPGIAAGVLLGRFGGGWIARRTWERPAAELVWNAGAAAASVLLGCWNGWLVLYAPKGRVLGGVLAAGGFLMGRLWLYFSEKKKE